MKPPTRHVVSQLLALYVIGVCALAHCQASERLEFYRPSLASSAVKSARRIAIIDFIHLNWWIVMPYLAVWFAFLLWMEIRACPRWAVWATFCALAMPCVAYAWGCWQVAIMAW